MRQLEYLRTLRGRKPFGRPWQCPLGVILVGRTRLEEGLETQQGPVPPPALISYNPRRIIDPLIAWRRLDLGKVRGKASRRLRP